VLPPVLIIKSINKTGSD